MSPNPWHPSRRPWLARARARNRQRGAAMLEYVLVLALLGVFAALALDERASGVKRVYLMRAQELMRPVP